MRELKLLRIKLNIPLKDLAKKVGISIGYLSRIENQRKRSPRLEKLILYELASIENSLKSAVLPETKQ